MNKQIEHISEMKLVGARLAMSLSSDQTRRLWSTFMPRRREILHLLGNRLYSVEIYPPGYFERFSPAVEFEKWAAAEVDDFPEIPPGLETLVIPPGQYAVFVYKGDPARAGEFYRQIFGNWLPQWDLVPDDRPHFACMGEKYRNNDPESEEEIWIPVRSKK